MDGVEPAAWTTWQNYWLWQDIEEAQRAVGWSVHKIEKRLHELHPTQYKPVLGGNGKLHGGLMKGVIHKWFKKDPNDPKQVIGWTEVVLTNVDLGSHCGAKSQSKILSRHPEVKQDIVAHLLAIHCTGTAIQHPLAGAIIRAHIQHVLPELIEGGFRISNTWVQQFLSEELGWSHRKTTRMARKVPRDAEFLCQKTHARLSYVTRNTITHPSVIVNPDQAGVLIVPIGRDTYEVRGSLNVPGITHEEKRQFTVVVASSMDGDMLPFQSVWGGTTAASLPSKKSAWYSEAKDLGFTYAHGDTRHWSSWETTIDWCNTILFPHIARMKLKHKLADTIQPILLLDAWPVHTAKKNPDDFLNWIQ